MEFPRLVFTKLSYFLIYSISSTYLSCTVCWIWSQSAVTLTYSELLEVGRPRRPVRLTQLGEAEVYVGPYGLWVLKEPSDAKRMG